MHHKLLTGTAAVAITVAISGIGLAADLPAQAAVVKAPAVALLNWTGPYIGGHLGYGEAKLGGDWQPTEAPPTQFGRELDIKGIVGGMHFGYNWQAGNYLYGLEADISAAPWGERKIRPQGSAIFGLDISYIASLRGRLGMLFNPSLLGYLTGGVAYTDAEGVLGSQFIAQKLKFGWGGVVGAGFEWKQTQSVSWRLEGLWYFYDKTKTITFEPSPAGTASDRFKLKDIWVIRAGVTHHF
jgi:outer membrane immunogenic protein